MEEWADIPGFPDYIAHRDGFIYSYLTNKFLSPGHTRGGYESVGLSSEGQVTQWRVNRLICTVFHGEPPEDKPLALHNNGNNVDNRAVNLRWGDSLDNTQDSIAHGTHQSLRTPSPHCPQGHLFTPENLIVLKAGSRRCRKCKDLDRRRRRTKILPQGDPRHGTLTGYTSWNCKCTECRKAAVNYRQNREKENNND